MKKYIEVEPDHLHLVRGGDILIHCIWVEKIMVDLIILKKHPKIIRKFNKPMPYKIPITMVKERTAYWEKSFYEIKKEFIKKFKPKEEIIVKINKIYVLRNAISHSNVKLGQKYFLFRPKRLMKIKKSKVFDLRKIPNQSKPVLLKLDYSNEKNYHSHFSIIQYLDQHYFKKEAERLNIIYSHMR